MVRVGKCQICYTDQYQQTRLYPEKCEKGFEGCFDALQICFRDALKTASSDWGPIVDKLQNIWLTHTGAVSITSNCINSEMIDARCLSLYSLQYI